MTDTSHDKCGQWYVDDGNGTGTLVGLASWFDNISSVGLNFGYFVNPGNVF